MSFLKKFFENAGSQGSEGKGKKKYRVPHLSGFSGNTVYSNDYMTPSQHKSYMKKWRKYR